MKNKLSVLITGFLILLSLPKSSFAAGVLVDCDKSPAFAKRQGAAVKKLEARLAKYEVGTPPYLALQNQIDRTIKIERCLFLLLVLLRAAKYLHWFDPVDRTSTGPQQGNDWPRLWRFE